MPRILIADKMYAHHGCSDVFADVKCKCSPHAQAVQAFATLSVEARVRFSHTRTMQATMLQEILTTRKARLSPFRSRIIGINSLKGIGGGRGDVVVANLASPQSSHLFLHCSRREDILFAIFV